jgi:putative FmdB family regulatory protein
MPSYTYCCKECDHHFEDLYKIDDRLKPTENPCPSCNKPNSIYLSLGAPPHMDIMATSIGTAKHRPTDEFREVMRRMKKHYPGARKTLKDY